MKKDGRQTRFRDDLRKVFLFYSLVPMVGAMVLLLCFLGYIPLKNVVAGAQTDLEQALYEYSAAEQAVTDELSAVSRELDVERYAQDVSYRAEVNQGLYRFCNAQSGIVDFYIMDDERELLGSSQSNAALKDACCDRLYWLLLRNLTLDGSVQAANSHGTLGEGFESNLLFGTAVMQGGALQGYLCMTFSETGMRRLVSPLDSSVLMTNEFHSVFLGSQSNMVGDNGKLQAHLREANGFTRHGSQLHYVASGKTSGGRFTIYAIKECGNILNTVFFLALLALAFYGLLILVIFVSTERVAAEKTKVIDEITSACKRVQSGDLTTEISISSNDEFQVIAKAYNRMLRSIRALMDKSMRLGQETAVSRIRQLESQFHPHFLFNTLENVRFMIRFDPQKAEQMITALSRLLRYSLGGDRKTETISTDMAFIESYMEIMKMRHGQRLTYHVDVPQELLDARIPRLVTQPIIENAIKYGVRNTQVLDVSLRARRMDDRIEIFVKDNGPGIDQAMLEELEEGMRRSASDLNGHYGILNAHERIKLMYGEDYGVKIESGEGGTVVTLSLPYLAGEEESCSE